MGYAILQITDCEHPPVILQSGGETGFHVTAWLPANPAIKGGGVWQDSPLSDGRRLAYAKRQNVRESLTVDVSGVSQDVVAAFLQDLKVMLDRAREYWIGEAQIKPVYLVARSSCETETRYAIIHDWSVPNDDFPYNEPFESAPPAMENITIEIERGNWLDTTHLDAAVNSCVHIGSPAVYDAVIGATLLTNGGFENPGAGAPDLWANWGEAGTCRNLTTEVTDMVEPGAYAGSFSAVVTTVGGQQSLVSQNFATVAGNRYRVELYHFEMNCDECGYIPGMIQISDAIGGGAGTIIYDHIDDVVGAYWKRYTIEFVAGAIATTIQLLSPAGKDGSVAYDEVSVKLVTSYTVGEVSECNNETYIVNHTQRAQLSHIYYYDASVPVFSANIAYPAAFPQALFPAAVAVNDILYIGIAAAALQSGPFDNVVFDLDLNSSSGYNVHWEYWNGGAWVGFAASIDNTNGFRVPGVCNISFWRPTNWATTVINAVNAWWIRARVTGVGVNINPVRQQNQYVYTATNPFFELADGEIGGDMDALGRIRHVAQSVGGAGFSGAIVGRRAHDRGTEFNAFVNVTNTQNPPGIQCTAGANTAATATPLASTGQLYRYTPPGADVMADRCNILIFSTIAKCYTGLFRAFVRCYTATANNFSIELRAEDALATFVYGRSAATLVVGGGTLPQCYDMGVFNLDVKDGISVRFVIAASAVAGGAGQVLDFYDLVLIPLDEFCCEYSFGTVIAPPYYADIDSISNPKTIIDSSVGLSPEFSFRAALRTVSNGALEFDRRRSRFWVLAANQLGAPRFAGVEYLNRIVARAAQQYNSLRGAR